MDPSVDFIHTPALDRLRTLKPTYDSLSKEADKVYKAITEKMADYAKYSSNPDLLHCQFYSMDPIIAHILIQNGFKVEDSHRKNFFLSEQRYRLSGVFVTWDSNSNLHPFRR